MEQDSLEKLHDEHHEWLEDITTWHNELMYYSRVLLRLVEGAKTGPDTDKMEQFKSRFDKLQEKFTEAAGKIKAHDHTMATAQGSDLHARHQAMRNEVSAFRKAFTALKNDFYKFEEKFIYE